MRFAFVAENRREFPVEALCRVLGVSRAGFYAWGRRQPGPRAERRADLSERIGRVHEGCRGTYGSPRIHRELAASGVACSENTVAKLMRRAGLRSKAHRRFVVGTTDSGHNQPIAPNTLDRRFRPERPDAAWAADITYIATARGWLCLAVVLDLCSRRVVGWATADHLRTELVDAALRMALTHRRPAAGLLHHSDRGVQYASAAYRAVLGTYRLEPSISRKENCYDNAVVESFFSTHKRELVHHEKYAIHEEATRSLFEYIEVFYNRRRLHSTLGYRSPTEFEESLT